MRRGKWLVIVGVLIGALALEGWAPRAAWAPPPPKPKFPKKPKLPKKPLRPRRRLGPRPLRPGPARPVVPVPVPVPVPTPVPAPGYRLKNLLGRPVVIDLPGGRTLYLPPRGSTPIAGADLSVPAVRVLLDRGDVVVLKVTP